MKKLKKAMTKLYEKSRKLEKPGDNRKLWLSQEIVEEIINIIQHLTCAMELFHCYMESQYKRNRKRIGQSEKEVLNGVRQNIESIINQYEDAESDGENESEDGTALFAFAS